MASLDPLERRAPDYCGPLIGYRLWLHDYSGLLRSVYQPVHWTPHEVCHAECDRAPRAPQPGCQCGIYAFRRALDLHKEIERIDRQGTALHSVFAHLGEPIFGTVRLWGNVIEHEYGWRAEYAYPHTLSSRVLADHYGVAYQPWENRRPDPAWYAAWDDRLHVPDPLRRYTSWRLDP